MTDLSDVQLYRLLTKYRDLANIAGEKFTVMVPTRWRADPHWRCLAGHVSPTCWHDDTHGWLCVECNARVQLTFPEDRTGPLADPDRPGPGP